MKHNDRGFLRQVFGPRVETGASIVVGEDCDFLDSARWSLDCASRFSGLLRSYSFCDPERGVFGVNWGGEINPSTGA